MTAAAAGRTVHVGLALRVFTAAALLVDAVVHLRLATGYQAAAPGGIGEGTLFRLEAAAALGAAAYLLVRGNRRSCLVALLVGLSAVIAVVFYRYVNVPAIGPLPSMYEPVWFPEKTASAVAEALAVVGAATLLTLLPGGGRPRRLWRRGH